MKLWALPGKRATLLDNRQKEEAGLALVLREITHGSKVAVVDHFLHRYYLATAAPEEAVVAEQHNIVWDGVLLTVQNTTEGRVVFIYGTNGLHAPTFMFYNKTKTHSTYKQYCFWEDEKLALLCTHQNTFKDGEPNLAQTCIADVLTCIFVHLSSEDVLSCRVVCRNWSRAGSRDAVWARRIVCPVPGYTGLAAFVRSVALLPSLDATLLLQHTELGNMGMRQIGRAWVHKYDEYIKQRRVPFDLHVFRSARVRAEDVIKANTKRPRFVRSIMTFQYLVAIHRGQPLPHKNREVKTVLAACIEDESGAVVWVPSEHKPELKIAQLKNQKPHETDNVYYTFRRMMLDYANHYYFNFSS